MLKSKYIMMTDDRFIHYTLGHPVLDKDHQEMFHIMGEISKLLRQQLFEPAEVLLDKLQKLATKHNNYEHGLMKLYEYPYMNHHLSTTDAVTATALKLRIHEGRNLSHFDIAHFEETFVNHIDHFDRQFVEYLKNKGLDIWKK